MEVLIVKCSSIGDIIQTFPVVQYLVGKFPGVGIDWVVEEEYRELVASHPLVRQVHVFPSRRWRRRLFASRKEIFSFCSKLRAQSYDFVFDLQGNIKSSFVTLCSQSSQKIGLGWSSLSEWPNYLVTHRKMDVSGELPIQRRYLEVVQSYFDDHEPFIPTPISLVYEGKVDVGPSRPRVMVACHSRWENKKVSSTALQQFLRYVAQEMDPQFYFVYGNEEEKKATEELMKCGKSILLPSLSFPLWQAFMREMDLVIAVDSAALALCGTTNTPSMSFFGPSRASIYRPLGDHHVGLQGICPYARSFTSRCSILRTCPTGACIKNISAQEMIERFVSSNLLARRK